MTTRSAPTLKELGPGVFAYLQQGSWGYSNAGLITDGDQSLLIDTLYDLRLTQQMLEHMRKVAPAAQQIDALVNTHANGDHCWGNQLVGEAKIISSRAAAHEMLELSPRLMHTLVGGARAVARGGSGVQRALALLGRLGIKRAGAMAEAASFIVESFGDFDFSGISLKLPTQTFDKQLTLQVGAKTVELIEVGPAHTKGDVIVHVPEQRIAYTGDILFIGSHPIIWEGPVGNWIAACDRLLALDVDVIVPGHGPITNKQGVATTRAYFQRLVEVTQQGRAAGQSAQAIAAELRAQHFDDWGEAHRLAVNVDTIYREQAHDRSARDPLTMLAAMARWDRLPA